MGCGHLKADRESGSRRMDTNSTAKTLLAENDKLQGNIRTSNWNAI